MISLFDADSKRKLSLLLVFAVVFVGLAGLFVSAVPRAEALSIAEIDQQQKELQKQIDANNAKIKEMQKQIQAAQNDQYQVRNQIKAVSEQLALLNEKLDLVGQALEIKKLEIDLKTQEIESNEALFEERVHRMYINNVSQSTLATLLEAKDFSDFLNRMEIMKRVSQNDQELINVLVQQKNDLSEMQSQMEAEQAELEATKAEAAKQEQELNIMYASIEDELSDLEQAEKQYIAKKAADEKQMKALEAEMEKALAEQAAANAYGDGVLKWPVPGYTTITSPFGWRTLYGQKDYHTGIDIGTSRKIGPAITASDAGKVVWVKKVNYGYGWHLLVDHGNGVATLYAHCSKIVVSQGDVVEKGQKIAEVGSTGNSTGPHLHFEVRIDGVQKNPQNYVVAGR